VPWVNTTMEMTTVLVVKAAVLAVQCNLENVFNVMQDLLLTSKTHKLAL
jgi:hypothetical protein